MPAPSTTITTLRPDLAGSMEEYPIRNAKLGAIANLVAIPIDVALQADTYGRIPIEEYLQVLETARASGAGYSRDDFNFIEDQYACREHGLEGTVDDRAAKRYKTYFDAELKQTERKDFQVTLAQEVRVSNLVMNATTFSGQTTAMGTALTDYASSTPVTKIEAACQAVFNRTGIWPNTLIMNNIAKRNLRHNAEVIGKITSSGAGDQARQADINIEQLSQVFDLPNILVGGMASNSANRGQAASISSAWPDAYMMVGYIDDSGDIEAPSLTRAFHWSDDGSEIGGAIETYREDDKRSTIVRVRHDVVEKIEYKELGQLITGVA